MHSPAHRRSLLASITLALTLGTGVSQGAQCPEWSPEFATAGADGAVRVQKVLPGGSSPLVAVGGDFHWIGEVEAKYVATFDGTLWSGLGPGAPGPVHALAQYDDGNGLEIYVGGDEFLARWDGSSWFTWPVAGDVRALHIHDDGNGLALFVGGTFTGIGGNTVRHLARYDGTFDSMSGGVTSGLVVSALESHDGGNGSQLYIGGAFQQVGGVNARSLARWDGSVFQQVGGSLQGGVGFGTQVEALCSFPGLGGVQELHVGGKFDGAGGQSTSRWIARRQNTWVDIGGGEVVFAFSPRADLGGTSLIAARQSGVEIYDGAARTSISFEFPSEALSVLAFGSKQPQDFYVGTTQPSDGASHYSLWNGTDWSRIFSSPGTHLGLSGFLDEFAVHDFGQGEELVALGVTGITLPPLLPEGRMLSYNGFGWRPVDTQGVQFGVMGELRSLGGDLFAVGSVGLDGVGGIYPVLRYDGASWETLGSPLSTGSSRGLAVELFDSGNGPELYCGVNLSFGPPNTRGIARFDGTDWVEVGGGMQGGSQGSVQRMLTWNNGAGEALYAAGTFVNAGTTTVNSIARWDGSQWTDLDGGLQRPGGQAQVFDMVLFNAPQGQQLVACGFFERAGNSNGFRGIAAWDGSQWLQLGTGIQQSGGAALPLRMAVHDPDGQGERLYVMGSFDLAGGVPVNGSAEWDGLSWSASALPPTGQPEMQVYDDGSGRALFVGGGFQSVAGVGSSNIAKFIDPCGDILGVPFCTSTPNSTGERALARARGSASVSADNLTLTAKHVPPNQFGLFFVGSEPNQASAGDGVLCIAGTLSRVLPVATTAGGQFSQDFDFQAPYAALAVAGQTIYAQGFFRDPTGGMLGFNTTDAIRIFLRP